MAKWPPNPPLRRRSLIFRLNRRLNNRATQKGVGVCCECAQMPSGPAKSNVVLKAEEPLKPLENGPRMIVHSARQTQQRLLHSHVDGRLVHFE